MAFLAFKQLKCQEFHTGLRKMYADFTPLCEAEQDEMLWMDAWFKIKTTYAEIC